MRSEFPGHWWPSYLKGLSPSTPVLHHAAVTDRSGVGSDASWPSRPSLSSGNVIRAVMSNNTTATVDVSTAQYSQPLMRIPHLTLIYHNALYGNW